MKKHIKLINILLICILITIFNGGCNQKTEYFHHAAIVETITNDNFEVNGNKYVYKNKDIYILEDDNKWMKIKSPIDVEEWITCIKVSESKIYIGSQTKAGEKTYLYTFDKNFNLIEKNETYEMFYFDIYEDWLYYCRHTSKMSLLYKYNPNAKDLVFICEFNAEEIINVDEKLIYVPYSNRYNIYILEEESSNNIFYSEEIYELFFVYNNMIGYVKEEEGYIFISYNGKEYKEYIGHWQHFYKEIIVFDNKIKFSSYNRTKKEEDYVGCEPFVPDCICEHDKSYVWEFDFITEKINLLMELEEKSYVIGFDEENIFYYQNSAIHKNDTLLYNYPTIEIGGAFNRSDIFYSGYRNDSHISLNYFYLYNESVYYYYLDCSSQVKDYYD